MSKLQKRTLLSELRTKDDETYIIEGYFAKFDDETELWPGAFEKIDKKAFNTSLKNDVRALINHDTSQVLGRTKSGTLELNVDDTGLYGKIHINQKDTEAMNLYERVKRGDVDQCSFGFFVKDEETEYREDGTTHWTLKDVELFEVSCCTFPAYENTSIEARKKDFELNKKRTLELRKEQLKERIKNVTKTIET